MIKWEYATDAMSAEFGNALETTLDGWGQDGWELVFCTPTSIETDGESIASMLFVFKRPVEEADDDG